MLYIHFDPPIASTRVEYQIASTICDAPLTSIYYALLPKQFASIIKIPPNATPVSGEIPYSELICTEEDKQKIAFLITVMAENGKLALLFRTRELRHIGDEIKHVHPLRFLGVIFSNPSLKASMLEIYNDYFKRNEFISGLGTSLTVQANRGKLDCYLNEFAKEVFIAPELLKNFIAARDWERFVYVLMKDHN